MKFEQKPIGELCDIVRKNIMPTKNIMYNLFSFSAFDNGRRPVATYGEDIKSSKLKVSPNMILFNKLNVQFKRVWNIGNLTLLNSICSTEFIPLQTHEGVDKNYLYYCLISDYITNAMYGARRGTSNSQQRISPSTLLNYKIFVPPFEEQRKISSILSALDDKIELNNKINENLLQQAQAVFRERFLSCNEMPGGWKRMTLGDASEMSAGGDKPKIISNHKTNECPYPIYSNGINDEGLYGFTNGYKVNEESVTVSARGTIGFICLRHIPFTPIVRLVTLIPHKEIISAKYLYLWLKNIPIHGTGTTQQQLTVPDFRKTEIVIPTEAEMNDFTDTIKPLFQQIWANQDENYKLAEVRDALLPKLMSGELDVSDLDL